jgi:hypothetical protein
MTTVLIRGDGVAACCCARLLERPGLHAVVETLDRPKVPAVMLSEATQKLLRDVFEREDLFEGLPRIHKRVVAWGADSKALALPHSAIVVSEQALLDRLAKYRDSGGTQPPRRMPSRMPSCPTPEWTILASRPLPASVEHHFGSRIGTAWSVKFKAGRDPHTCWVESLDRGWLFLLPGEGQNGWLLSVGDTSERLLGQSRVVAEQIVETVAAAGSFHCYPRITEPLCGPGWLACGTGAVGFDPLCGDGAGYATREAILGSAVVRAAAAGADADAVAAHYRARLVGGFQRHLEVCRQFYETGGSGPWWNQEADSLRRGLDWCRVQLDGAPAFRYRLNGFALEAIDQASGAVE